MMDFELKLEKPDTSRAWKSALTMGLAYFFGTCSGSLPPHRPPPQELTHLQADSFP